jgi:hypothetical protein
MEKEKLKNPKNQQPTDSSDQSKDYGKYFAIAFQMGITIALGVWGGIKLDEYFGLKKLPVFMLSLSLLSIAGSLYFMIKELTKK